MKTIWSYYITFSSSLDWPLDHYLLTSFSTIEKNIQLFEKHIIKTYLILVNINVLDVEFQIPRTSCS